MKYIINILAIAFLGFPALVLGYLYEVITDSFSTGRFICSKHTDAATEKFCNNHD